MTEKEIYKLADEVLELSGTLYHLVPDSELARKTSMQNCFDRIHESIINMARMANASQQSK
jgi:hypothetical protein